MKSYLENFSPKFAYLKETQGDIDEIAFYHQYLFDEENLIIFLPYFTKWVESTRSSEEAIILLQEWMQNDSVSKIYFLTTEKVLDLLAKWDIHHSKDWKINLDKLKENLKKFHIRIGFDSTLKNN